MVSQAEIEKAARLLRGAHRLCALTGAGISAESGLATFRAADGLWENHRIEDVATPEGFARDPELVWRFYHARRKAARGAKPNPGHLALAGLERKGRAVDVLTQNVDGLHSAAGSRAVVELHGSLWRARCTACPHREAELPVELPVLPPCPSCRKLLRPDIVWFNEQLDPRVVQAAAAAVARCDALLVIGTSAQVYPAAAFAFDASGRGTPVIEINPEATAFSREAALALRGPSGEVLPLLFEGL